VVAIRTTVILGDGKINGGNPNSRANTEGAGIAGTPTLFLGAYGGLIANFPLFAQTVPSDPATGVAPVSPAYTPYWDGIFQYKTGTTTGATANTLTVSGTPWGVNELKERNVVILSGVGVGQVRRILSNTANTITVTTDWTTPPTASTFEVRGAWVVFHHTNGRSPNTPVPYIPGCSGDNWYEFGGGVTIAGMYLQMMKQNYGTSSPYFRVFKQAADGGYGSGASPWKTAGWAAFEAEFAGAVNAAAFQGDTLAVDCVVLDASYTDLVNGNLSYQTDLQAVIDLARAKFPTALIVLVSHHPEMEVLFAGNPINMQVARGINTILANNNNNVRVLDLAWAQFGSNSPLISPIVPAEPREYTLETHIQSGVALYNLVEAWRIGTSDPTPGKGIRVLVLVCDSQGATLNPLYAYHSGQPSVLGPNPLSSVRPKQWIYDKRDQSIHLYDTQSNPTTVPSVPGSAGSVGPENTALRAMFRDADPDDVVVFKYSKSGVAVTTEADDAGASGALEMGTADYNTLVSDWNDFVLAVMAEGFIPDCWGLGLLLTDNDDQTPATATALAAKLPKFVDDMREVFTTRATGGPLPVVFVQPPEHIANGGTSIHGNAAARAANRATVLALESSKPRLKVLRSDPIRYEISKDQIHYGGEAQTNLGEDIVAAIEALSALPAATVVASDPSEPVATTPEAAIAAAMAEAPDIETVSLPDGTSFKRRSADDLIALEKNERARSARARGIFKTRARFLE